MPSLSQLAFAVQIHLVAVAIAVVAAAMQFGLPKGNQLHRLTGYTWASAMIVAAFSSFWINKEPWIGPFGPIHILSVITLIGVPRAVMAARKGQIRAHQLGMIQLVGFALLGAGLFAVFLPGRYLHHLVFGT